MGGQGLPLDGASSTGRSTTDLPTFEWWLWQKWIRITSLIATLLLSSLWQFYWKIAQALSLLESVIAMRARQQWSSYRRSGTHFNTRPDHRESVRRESMHTNDIGGTLR